jgi:4-amino-4-deoxy-L-arabinose transferase-like glycosyltransferase
LALGAGLATKMNVLPLVPVFAPLAILSYRRARPGWWRAVAAGAGVLAIALAVVWLSSLAVDPRLRGAAAGVPEIAGVRGVVTDLLPVPEWYRDGLRIQFGFEDGTWGGFLFGREYTGSVWYYLPVAVLVKTPIGLLVLGLAGVGTVLSVRRLRPAAPYLLVPVAVLFAVAMTGARDFGVRYVLFLPMFLAVAAATVITPRPRWVKLGAVALVLYAAVSSAATYPYYLPYSNEAFGGPSNTWRLLHDSNSDWGQDLGRMADRLRTRYPGQPVWLVYQGGGVPAYYGIRASDPLTVPPDRVRGLLVVSNDRIDKPSPKLTVLLATSTPIDSVGHSMTIFRR